MKPRPSYFLIFLAAITSLLLYSCDKKSPAYNRENIKGVWVADVYDGILISQRKTLIYEFTDQLTAYIHGTMNKGGGNYQWGKDGIFYDVYCCNLHLYGDVEGLYEIPTSITISQNFDFTSSEDSLVTMQVTSNTINGEDVTSEYNFLTMRKLTSTYAAKDSIVGVWQFATKGTEVFDGFRLHFFASDSIQFLSKNSDEWVPVSYGNQYYLFDDFLALNLYNNAVFGKEGLWEVAFFNEMSASPTLGTMSMVSDGVTYSLVRITDAN